MVKNLPAMQETWVHSLVQEDSLEEEMLPTSVCLPGESHGQRSLVGYSPWGHKESKMTERLTLSHFHNYLVTREIKVSHAWGYGREENCPKPRRLAVTSRFP